MKRIILAGALLCVVACSPEPGSKAWCEAKEEQPKSEWSAADASTYTSKCLFESRQVGSEAWCKDLAEKPKGEWTANEASSYAKHCVM